MLWFYSIPHSGKKKVIVFSRYPGQKQHLNLISLHLVMSKVHSCNCVWINLTKHVQWGMKRYLIPTPFEIFVHAYNNLSTPFNNILRNLIQETIQCSLNTWRHRKNMILSLPSFPDAPSCFIFTATAHWHQKMHVIHLCGEIYMQSSDSGFGFHEQTLKLSWGLCDINTFLHYKHTAGLNVKFGPKV